MRKKELKNQNCKIKSITPTKKIEQEVKDGYYITIEFMFGDADGYTKEEMGPFSKDEMELLFDAVETIERCVNAYPHGRGGYDTYNHVKGFHRWFEDYSDDYDEDDDSDDYDENDENEENGDEEEIKDPPSQMIEMVYEPNDWGIQASFENYTVNYYENGIPYECEIKWDK